MAPAGDGTELQRMRRGRNVELWLGPLVLGEVATDRSFVHFLIRLRDGGVDLTHGKVKRETKIAKSDKNPLTRDLEIEIQGVTTYSRLVLAGNRLYVIMAYPDGTQGSPERAKLFLDSFKLVKDEAAGRTR